MADTLAYRIQALTGGLTDDTAGEPPKVEDITLGVMTRLATTGESRGGPDDALLLTATPAIEA